MEKKIKFIIYLNLLLIGCFSTSHVIFANSDYLFDSQKIIMVGTLNKGGGDVTYKSKVINEFTLLRGGMGECNGYNNLCVKSEKLKKEFYGLLGKQVMIFGDSNAVSMDAVMKENPFSKCLKNLTKMDYGFVETEKIEPVNFYTATFPSKIIWGQPLKFIVQLTNPFNEEIILFLHTNSYRDIYRGDKKTVTLSQKQIKNVEIILDPLKSDKVQKDRRWFREGTFIQIFIEGGPYSENDKNYIILVDDKIATYNSNGELQNEKSECLTPITPPAAKRKI